MNKRRVVITGLGMLSPLGNTVDTSWKALISGKSGVTQITHFDTTNMPVKIAATVKNFEPSPVITPKDARRMDIFIQYGMVAAAEAIKDSGIDVSNCVAERIGVALGSGIGGLSTIEQSAAILAESGPRRISPFFIPATIINLLPGHVSIQYGYKGPNISIVSACTTGAHNIGYAARTIIYGDADVMIAGGAEKASTPLGIAGFAAARSLSTRNDDPEAASRPWDRDRDGFVLGDGAGVLVLEEYEHAKRRGAQIYAEIAGFGMSADAYHMTSPSEGGEGAARCLMNTLKDARMNADEIDYVNAHATSTEVGDISETMSVKSAFGEHAYKLAISSTKSATGHLLGAAGAIEAVFSVLALRDQVAPSTLNLEHPGEGCDLDYIPKKARKMTLNAVLSTSFGFGGTNGALIFKKI